MTTTGDTLLRCISRCARFDTDPNYRLEYAKAISALWTILTQVENRRGLSGVARMWAVTVTGLLNREGQ